MRSQVFVMALVALVVAASAQPLPTPAGKGTPGVTCGSFSDCASCSAISFCGWCAASNACVHATVTSPCSVSGFSKCSPGVNVNPTHMVEADFKNDLDGKVVAEAEEVSDLKAAAAVSAAEAKLKEDAKAAKAAVAADPALAQAAAQAAEAAKPVLNLQPMPTLASVSAGGATQQVSTVSEAAKVITELLKPIAEDAKKNDAAQKVADLLAPVAKQIAKEDKAAAAAAASGAAAPVASASTVAQATAAVTQDLITGNTAKLAADEAKLGELVAKNVAKQEAAAAPAVAAPSLPSNDNKVAALKEEKKALESTKTDLKQKIQDDKAAGDTAAAVVDKQIAKEVSKEIKAVEQKLAIAVGEPNPSAPAQQAPAAAVQKVEKVAAKVEKEVAKAEQKAQEAVQVVQSAVQDQAATSSRIATLEGRLEKLESKLGLKSNAVEAAKGETITQALNAAKAEIKAAAATSTNINEMAAAVAQVQQMAAAGGASGALPIKEAAAAQDPADKVRQFFNLQF